MVAVDPRAHRLAARPQPRRGEHGGWRRLRAGRPPRAAAGASSTATSGCSRSTSSGSGRWSRSCSRARCCSPTCSATSSTATASSTRSPTAGPPSSSARPAGTQLVLNADDPLVADLGRKTRGAVLRRRGRQRRPHRAPARLGLQALPQLRRTPTSTTPPTWATSATTTARNCGNRRPEPGGGGRVGPAARHPLGRLHAAHARRLDARRAAAPRALQRLQRARRRRAVPRARRRAADDRGRPRRRRARLRPRRDDRPRRPRDLDPAGQEPGGRERGPAHARARGRRARPLRRPQRPHRRRPRRLVGVGRRLGDGRAARARA